ncbi:MAG: fumarylacetoacetate hydrolase family protein [Candidatus Helarchaeota archaeon]
MKLVNFQMDDSIKTGFLIDEEWILEYSTSLSLIGENPPSSYIEIDVFKRYADIHPKLEKLLAKSIEESSLIPLKTVNLIAPILNPSKIICLGLNYKDHAAETGHKLPKLPMLFAKAPSAIIGPEAAIEIPQARKRMNKTPTPIQFVDYEVELAIVIGKQCKRVPVNAVADYILGYTILNDVSARMEQVSDQQFFRSKSFDTFAPLGPWIVTADELGDPMNLELKCYVNGNIRQQSNTTNMNFNVFEIVSYISDSITLKVGDVIGTGTPPGVGVAQNPPQSLKPGDQIEMTIEKIGTLRNYVKT